MSIDAGSRCSSLLFFDLLSGTPIHLQQLILRSNDFFQVILGDSAYAIQRYKYPLFYDTLLPTFLLTVPSHISQAKTFFRAPPYYKLLSQSLLFKLKLKLLYLYYQNA